MLRIKTYNEYLEAEFGGNIVQGKPAKSYVVKKLRSDKVLFGPAGRTACNNFVDDCEFKCVLEEVVDTQDEAVYADKVSHARAAYRQALYGKYSSELIELYEQIMASQGALVDMYHASYPTMLEAFAATLCKYKDLMQPIADEVAIVLGSTSAEQAEPEEETQ